MSDNAIPYTSFERQVEKLADKTNEDIYLIFSQGEWEIRLGDPAGLSETFADSAFEAVLDCLDN